MIAPNTDAQPPRSTWRAFRRAAVWVGVAGSLLLVLNCVELYLSQGRGHTGALVLGLGVGWCLPLAAGQWHSSWKVAWLTMALVIAFAAAAVPVLVLVSWSSGPPWPR